LARRDDCMKMSYELKYKGRNMRKCRICGTARGLIRSYSLYVCRRCFREIAPDIGFDKFR
jgi:small subunit ribosomal protein S14